MVHTEECEILTAPTRATRLGIALKTRNGRAEHYVLFRKKTDHHPLKNNKTAQWQEPATEE